MAEKDQRRKELGEYLRVKPIPPSSFVVCETGVPLFKIFKHEEGQIFILVDLLLFHFHPHSLSFHNITSKVSKVSSFCP
jgi:hypothetical protein